MQQTAIETKASAHGRVKRQVSRKGTAKRSWFTYFSAIAFGITPIVNKEAKVKEWQMTATVSALLTGASAAGLFKTAGGSAFALNEYGEPAGLTLSRWTTSSFCITVFLFLTSSVTSAFFTTFALSTSAGIFAIKRALGGAFWMPGAYFRLGYVMLVVSLCLFFIMHMQVTQMLGCITFCFLCMILPMVLAMGRAMATVVETDDLHFDAAAYSVAAESSGVDVAGVTKVKGKEAIEDDIELGAYVDSGNAD